MNVEEPPGNTPDYDARPEGLSETISQFVARVLGQLSLFAWLPAGALVLALTFVVKLNSVLDNKVKPKDAGDAVGRAFDAMTGIGFSGVLLLFSIVVVLTVLTQVFAFDAILTLQGYWGTLRVVEWIAKYRCEHFRSQCTDLCKRRAKLSEEAQSSALSEIESWYSEAIARQVASGELDRAGRILAEKAVPPDLLNRYAPPDLLRRLANVNTRLHDFPHADSPRLSRIMPTRLGNVLRSYIDQLESEEVGQALILGIYGRLPPHLRAQHDEWRVRLNLYCSMFFVVFLTTAATAGLFAPQHWLYAMSVVVVGIVAMWLMYRGAIATARYYGLLLLSIKDYRLSSVEGVGSES